MEMCKLVSDIIANILSHIACSCNLLYELYCTFIGPGRALLNAMYVRYQDGSLQVSHQNYYQHFKPYCTHFLYSLCHYNCKWYFPNAFLGVIWPNTCGNTGWGRAGRKLSIRPQKDEEMTWARPRLLGNIVKI